MEPTFDSIACRLAVLVARIETTPDIQAEGARLIVHLTAARELAETARTTCAASDTKQARKRLLQAAKRLQKYVRRLGRRAAQRVIPALLRAELMDAGDALRSDVKTLRSTLACPGDAG